MSEPAGIAVLAAAPVITTAEAASVGLSASQAAAVTTLVRAQAAARVKILAGTSLFLARLLGRFTGWYDEVEVLTLASRADVQVRAAQQASADLTLAYQRQMLARLEVRLSKADLAAARLVVPGPDQPGLRGVDFLAEWERPVKAYRYERANGAADEVAIQAAVARAQRMADAAESLAMRRAAQRVLAVAAGLDPDVDLRDANADVADPDFEALQASLSTPQEPAEPPTAPPTEARVRVVGYRRVLHPELSKTGVCGLCLVAADRLYTVKELLPIHALCKCEVAPVTERAGKVEDPGKALNRADLDRVYAAGGGTDAASLKRVKIRVDEHGELGSVIAPASRRTRSATATRAASRNPGESDLDKARRLADLSAQQVTYLQGLIAGGQTKYAPTLAVTQKLLKQRQGQVRRLQRTTQAA